MATEVEPNFCAARRASGRRQGLRQGLRAGAEDLQPEPRADADEAHQPEEGARRGSGLRADLLGRGARPGRREAERDARARGSPTNRAIRASRRASAAAARRSPTWAPFPRSSPPGARSTWASARGRASSATTRSTCTASSGTARSPCRPTRRSRDYLISCGANVEASGGVVGVWRHAERARARHEARAGRAAPVGHRRVLGANGCRSSRRPMPRSCSR